MTRRTTPSALPALRSPPLLALLLPLAVGLLGSPLAAWAQTSKSSPTAAVATARADAQSPARVDTRGEPAVQQRVLEDEHIVIEELLVRGQPVRISVRGKAPGARGYEVNVGPGGRDASQESGRAGQSAWRLFSF